MENGSKSGNKLENFKGFFKPKKGSKESSDPDTPTPAAKSWKGFFRTAAQEETANSALLGLLFYSLLMFFLPLGVFFCSKQMLEDHEFEPPVSTIAPAILAIITVNIVIILYVVKAFREENKAKQGAGDKKEM